MPDRRTVIADAVIATLAEHGSRGLTHRAVDRAAGLPPGSTSYYLRTRESLLHAAITRLAELDAAEVNAAPRAGRQDPVAAIVTLLERTMTAGRQRQLARYELVLEATRRPDLHDAVLAGTERLVSVMAAWFEPALDSPAARALARDLLALIDGVLIGAVTGTHGPPLTRADLHRLASRFVATSSLGTAPAGSTGRL